MQLANVILRVRSPETLARFYVEQLGMTMRQQGDDNAVLLGYTGSEGASIQLCRAESRQSVYEHKGTDYYWKIGITLPNVDTAYKKLCTALRISQPCQFQDIGYMCHLQDPEGFNIELLQHTFEGNRGAQSECDEVTPFSGARVGQITLRCFSHGIACPCFLQSDL